MTLTSVTGFDYGRWYEKSDDGGLPITARLDDPNTYFSSVNAFSQELRLASRDTGAFGWLAGLYYGRESMHATVEFHFFDGYHAASFALPPDGHSALRLRRVQQLRPDQGQHGGVPQHHLHGRADRQPARGRALHQGQGHHQQFLRARGRPAPRPRRAMRPMAARPTGRRPSALLPRPSLTCSTRPRSPPQGRVEPASSARTTTTSASRVGADWKPTDDVLTYAHLQPGLPRSRVQRPGLQLPGGGELRRARKSSTPTRSA